jgi:EmrB/QacA subfamily drug resistance transporter
MSKSNNTQSWLVPVFITLIGGFMSVLDSSIINVAIPSMMHVFNVSTSQIDLVVTIYMLVLGVVIPFSGWAGDRFGYKQLYTAALGMFTLGSFLCAISWSFQTLIVARVIQAIGGGVLMPVMMTMVKKVVPKKNFGSAMGLVGIAMLIAPALGPTIGGYLVEYVGWRWIFTINLPIGVIGVLLAVFFLPAFPKKETDRLDIGGAVTSVLMLFSILMALSEGSTWGWSSEPIVLLFYLFAVSLVLFIIIELTVKNPLLNLRIFKNITFTMANVMSAISNIGLYTGIFYIPLFLQNIKGMGALDIGLLMLPGALLSGLMMPVCGKLYDLIGPRIMSIIGIFFLALTTFLFHNITIDTTNGTILFWLILRGIALPFTAVPAQTAALDVVPSEEASGASSLINIVSRVASSFGITILTVVLTSQTAFYTATTSWGISSSGQGISQLMQKFSSALGSAQVTLSQAKSLGLSVLSGLVQENAFVRSIDDLFLITTAVVIIGIIPAVFLKRGEKG